MFFFLILLSFYFVASFQPIMDGFGCIEALHRAGCTLPIFFISANSSSQVGVRCGRSRVHRLSLEASASFWAAYDFGSFHHAHNTSSHPSSSCLSHQLSLHLSIIDTSLILCFLLPFFASRFLLILSIWHCFPPVPHLLVVVHSPLSLFDFDLCSIQLHWPEVETQRFSVGTSLFAPASFSLLPRLIFCSSSISMALASSPTWLILLLSLFSRVIIYLSSLFFVSFVLWLLFLFPSVQLRSSFRLLVFLLISLCCLFELLVDFVFVEEFYLFCLFSFFFSFFYEKFVFCFSW